MRGEFPLVDIALQMLQFPLRRYFQRFHLALRFATLEAIFVQLHSGARPCYEEVSQCNLRFALSAYFIDLPAF